MPTVVSVGMAGVVLPPGTLPVPKAASGAECATAGNTGGICTEQRTCTWSQAVTAARGMAPAIA